MAEFEKNHNPNRTAEEEARQIEAMNKVAVEELSTEDVEIVGIDDSSLKRVMAVIHIVKDPRKKRHVDLTYEQAFKVVEEHLGKHCGDIGWWPSGEMPDFTIGKKVDGSWVGVALLKKSTRAIGAKMWSEFPRVGVDTQRAGGRTT